MKKRREYQKENARILVSRSCGDQLIELGVERRRGWGRDELQKGRERLCAPYGNYS